MKHYKSVEFLSTFTMSSPHASGGSRPGVWEAVI